MDEFYTIKRIIQAHEVDFTNRLRIDSLFTILQDTAAGHADKLNLGYKALIEYNLGWVLSWAKLEIELFPAFGEEISIRTWPKNKYKLYSLRDFYIYDNNGQIICKATTAWLPINIKSKKIIDTLNLPAPINYQENESAINELPSKIPEVECKEIIFSKTMKYSDIDLNQHVNNIKYIELISDCFHVGKYQKSSLKSISVNFVSECKYGDEIDICCSIQESDKADMVEGINRRNSKIVFLAFLKWKEIH